MPARQHRIRRGEDYRLVVRRGHRVGGAYSITHAVFLSENQNARFGFIVSKTVGGAVVRNQVRRRMKAIVEEQLARGVTGIDIVFRMLPRSADASFAELRSEVVTAMARLEKMGTR